MRAQTKELSWIARMNLIIGSAQLTPMSWSIENKVGVVILIRGIRHADAQCPGGTLVSGSGLYTLLR